MMWRTIPCPAPRASAALAFVLLGVLGMATAATGALPLFRQALEETAPSNYRVLIFYRGDLDADAETLFTQLREAPARLGANLEVSTVDLSGQPGSLAQALWNTQTNAQVPWMIVQPPATGTNAGASATPVWSGPFKPESVATLLDSPARRTIAAALLRGDLAVWVLLECGEPVPDEGAVDELASTLKSLEKGLRLTAPSPTDPKPRSPLPLQVAFSLVRVTRNDPAEDFFVADLRQGLALSRARPAAYPVFGRGRTLPPLIGKRITAKAIQQTCKRLATPPGTQARDTTGIRSLLLPAQWSTIFEAPELARATGTNSPADTKTAQSSTAASGTKGTNATNTNAPGLATAAPPSDPPAAGTGTGNPASRVPPAVLIALGVILVAGFAVALARRRPRT